MSKFLDLIYIQEAMIMHERGYEFLIEDGHVTQLIVPDKEKGDNNGHIQQKIQNE